MTDYSSSNPKQPCPRRGDESPGAVEFLYDGLSHKVLSIIRPQHSSSDWDEDQKYTKPTPHAQSIWLGRLPSKIHIGLIITWIVVLWWGERGAFSASISHCDWNTWEQWVGRLDGLRKHITRPLLTISAAERSSATSCRSDCGPSAG